MLSLDTKWDTEADIVIIGYGAGGAMAALTAADEGANVLILEKQRFGHGPEVGNHYSTSHMSGGVYLQPTDRAGTIAYFQAMSRVGKGYTTPDGYSGDDLIEAYTDEALQNLKWLQDRNFNVSKVGDGAEHPFEGVDTFESYRFEASGVGMMRTFEALIEKNPRIKVMYETAASRLLQDMTGEIVGVRATTGEANPREINIRAGRNVVMAMGGFEFDDKMKLNFLRVFPSYFTGSEACTGDGVRMAIDVGAELWHMNCVSARLVMKFPEFPSAISAWMTGVRPTPYILVDRYGRRYTNEKIKGHTVYYETTLFDSQKLDYPRIPSFWIFDEERMNSAKLAAAGGGITGSMGRYAWSSGNKEELARGWVKTGDTLKELSANLGIEGDLLEKTVETYNGYTTVGHDPEFNRLPEELLPLGKGPYFGVPVFPGGPNTQGGAKHNPKGQVLNVDGEPIPGLYAVGEFGSMFGMLYPSAGGNLSECFAMGRIVGRNAAKFRE